MPCRTGPGPIDVAMCLQADHPELLPRLWALNEALGPSAHDYEPVLQYWSNGNRSVAEIGEMAWLELGRPADEHTLAYFKLLAEAGLIELRQRRGARRARGRSGTEPLRRGVTCRAQVKREPGRPAHAHHCVRRFVHAGAARAAREPAGTRRSLRSPTTTPSAGVTEAQAAGDRLGVEVIPGVEINTDVKAGEVHVLGYFVDPRHAS